MKFSDILRYMYSQSGSELIPAERELEYIRQYVDLQKLRLNSHTKVDLNIEITNKASPYSTYDTYHFCRKCI